MSNQRHESEEMQITLAPERGIETAHVGVWVALAAILWSLIAIPALMI
jgi:hypothetical protein